MRLNKRRRKKAIGKMFSNRLSTLGPIEKKLINNLFKSHITPPKPSINLVKWVKLDNRNELYDYESFKLHILNHISDAFGVPVDILTRKYTEDDQ